MPSTLISDSQSAFLWVHDISTNILLIHDLIHGIHLSSGKPRLCIKIDLKEVFDSVSWEALLSCLARMNFNEKWLSWIKSCTSEPAFSVIINGFPHGFFTSSIGIRQGDALSLVLFTFITEVTSIALQRLVDTNVIQTPFQKGNISISHFIFAVNLMIFCIADPQTVSNRKNFLDEFSALYGLKINLSKSHVFILVLALVGIACVKHSWYA